MNSQQGVSRSMQETMFCQAGESPGRAQPVIAAHDVNMHYSVPKRYREYLSSPFRSRRYAALQDFTLELPEGGSLAVLGSNGSGKTTLLRLIAGLLYPTAGTIRVRGCLPYAKGNRSFCVGIVLNEERSFYWRLTGRQNLEFFGCLDNLFGKQVQERVSRMLELVGLERAADARVSDYSSGMRQRLAIARGLLANPQVLILDEPTKSLDPAGANEVRDVIRNELRVNKTTLVLATHNMAEAQQLVSYVCVLDKGRLLAYKPMEEVRQQHGDLSSFYVAVSEDGKQEHARAKSH